MVDVSVSGVRLVRRDLRRTRSESAENALGRFVRTDAWNGLRAGDVVRVAGQRARGRHFRFRAHVTNTSNGASWVEVALVDGAAPARRPGKYRSGEHLVFEEEAPRVQGVRSFAPELVTPRWRRRRAGDQTAEQASLF